MIVSTYNMICIVCVYRLFPWQRNSKLMVKMSKTIYRDSLQNNLIRG